MARRNDVQVTVYDADNKPHLMTHLNARDMITHRGWSMVPVDKKAVASGEALLAEALASASASNVDLTAIQKELDGKTKAEMIALAAERYGSKIDGRKAESVIIAMILELETEAQIAGTSKTHAAADTSTGEVAAADVAAVETTAEETATETEEAVAEEAADGAAETTAETETQAAAK